MLRDMDLLAMVVQTPGCLPANLVGAPGIGKTARVNALAAGLNWRLETLSPGMRGEGAFGVVPVPDMDANVLRYPPPDWVVGFEKDERPGLLFVDEINTAAPALQPPLLGLMHEGRIGDTILPKRVSRCAAMNPTELAASGWDLPPALANRLIYLEWSSPNVEEWTTWLLGTNEQATGFPIVNLETWEREFNNAKALVAAFLKVNPGKLEEDPDKLKGRFPMAYATPRTWEAMTRLLATCRTVESPEAVMPLGKGAIGEPIAIEFSTWLRENDLPDPERLLADPDSWKIDPTKTDRLFATCIAVAKAALSKGNGKPYTKKELQDRWCRAWHVLDRVLPHGKDLVILPANDLAKSDVRPDGGLSKSDVREIVLKISPVAFAAGAK
jgi:MoxR-like ATPase